MPSVSIIAEAGVNHNGDISIALELVDAAAAAGADFVKFQTFDPDLLATPAAEKASYQIRSTDKEETQLDMLRKLALSLDEHKILNAHCSKRGIEFLSTPFDDASAEMLVELSVPFIKISSGGERKTPEFVGEMNDSNV